VAQLLLRKSRSYGVVWKSHDSMLMMAILKREIFGASFGYDML